MRKLLESRGDAFPWSPLTGPSAATGLRSVVSTLSSLRHRCLVPDSLSPPGATCLSRREPRDRKPRMQLVVGFGAVLQIPPLALHPPDPLRKCLCQTCSSYLRRAAVRRLRPGQQVPRGAGGWKAGTTEGGERQGGSLMQRQKSSPLSDEKGRLGEGHGRLTECKAKLHTEGGGRVEGGRREGRGSGSGQGRTGG